MEQLLKEILQSHIQQLKHNSLTIDTIFSDDEIKEVIDETCEEVIDQYLRIIEEKIGE